MLTSLKLQYTDFTYGVHKHCTVFVHHRARVAIPAFLLCCNCDICQEEQLAVDSLACLLLSHEITETHSFSFLRVWTGKSICTVNLVTKQTVLIEVTRGLEDLTATTLLGEVLLLFENNFLYSSLTGCTFFKSNDEIVHREPIR